MGKDMRGTPVARVLEDYFDGVAQGNEGDSEVELLDLDGSVLTYKVKIRHRHTQRVRIPFDGTKTVIIYSITNYAEGKVDVLNPDPRDQEICVDTPVGKLCVTLVEVIQIIAATL